MDPHIDKAKADLASREGVATDDIVVREARFVTWPDSSMGCPQPDMAYTQVQVDGTFIQLSIGTASFNYHSGGSRDPFLCEKDRPAPSGDSDDV